MTSNETIDLIASLALFYGVEFTLNAPRPGESLADFANRHDAFLEGLSEPLLAASQLRDILSRTALEQADVIRELAPQAGVAPTEIESMARRATWEAMKRTSYYGKGRALVLGLIRRYDLAA